MWCVYDVCSVWWGVCGYGMVCIVGWVVVCWVVYVVGVLSVCVMCCVSICIRVVGVLRVRFSVYVLCVCCFVWVLCVVCVGRGVCVVVSSVVYVCGGLWYKYNIIYQQI